MRKRMLPRIKAAFTVLLGMIVLMGLQTRYVLALDDDEFSGYAADTLTVKVGYFGGPYYEKHVFTLEELWGLDVITADYTFIDNMPSVVIDHVVGVRLADVMDAAGIDLNSIQYFYFYTNDVQGGYYSHPYTKASLIDTPRYCYYSLPDNYDEETGLGNEFATSYGVPVDTLLALADDWTRTIAGATFGSDYLNLNTNTRFRLVFGQTDAATRNATESAKWIHEIAVELGGAPTLTLDASALEGEVGSVLRTEAQAEGEPTVLANSPIEWRSSDEAIATVDGSGNITVHGEGTAVITATMAGVSASVTVNGTSNGGDGTVGGEGETGQGEGQTPGEGEAVSGGAGESAAETEDDPGVIYPQLQETETPQQTAAPTQTATPTPTPTLAPVVTPEPTPIEEPPPVENANDDAPEPLALAEQPAQVNLRRMKAVTLAQTERDAGGVQNWRDTEMSETARELPNIEVQPALLNRMGLAAAGLFLGSGAVYAALFYKNVGKGKRKR